VKPDHRDTIGLVLALLAALFAHRFALDLELMGWDTYPTIAASQVHGLADLLGSFSEELMDGRYPGGHFYRPLTNLVFALDHAVWGLRPFGYHMTNLLILLAGVLAVFVLARRWLGPGWGPCIAALVFAIHPLQLETVPVAARRADMLFTLFAVWALAVQPLGARCPSRALALGALFVLLSAASKETGAIALPLVAGAQWILPSHAGSGERTRRTLRRCLLPAAAFGGFLVLRTAVLGGIGGHPGSSALAGGLRGLASLPDYARSLLMPQPWSESPGVAGWLLLAVALGLLAALGLALLSPPHDIDRERPAPARLLAFLAFWLVCLLVMTGISGEAASWYAVPFLPPYALLLGQLAASAVAAGRDGRKGLAVAVGVVALVLTLSHLRYSALIESYDSWREVSRQERDFLERLHASLADAAPGTTLVLPGLPLGTGVPLERVGVRSALCLSDYSVQAYADLAFPELPVRVRLRTGGAATPPAPGVVTVDAVPLPSPALQLLPPGASP
jgi:hypothetical protein